MMNAHVANLLNEQINKEFYSAYLYLDFANYFERIGLAGFAHYFKVQAQEERDHALMFYQYLQDSDQPVTLEAIARPDSRLGDRMEPLRQALEHEEFVTASINAIYAAAAAEQDYRTLRFLDWFINEQAEEEKSARDLIAKMEQFGSDAQGGLYLLDQELAARVYTAPVQACPSPPIVHSIQKWPPVLSGGLFALARVGHISRFSLAILKPVPPIRH